MPLSAILPAKTDIIDGVSASKKSIIFLTCSTVKIAVTLILIPSLVKFFITFVRIQISLVGSN